MILMKDIIREGHETLRKKAAEISLPVSNDDKNILIQLLQYVINSQDKKIQEELGIRPAVGLAAPQINISKRMFAILTSDLDDNLFCIPIINPVIIKKSKEMIYLPLGEGCLSVDRDTFNQITPRHEKITIEGLILDLETQTFKKRRMNLSGYISIVFQHEFDHLNGILFTDKMYPELKDAKPLYEIEDEDTSN